MELALLSLPIGVLAVLIIGIPIILAVVVLLLVRAWVPYQQLEPHHDGYGRRLPKRDFHLRECFVPRSGN